MLAFVTLTTVAALVVLVALDRDTFGGRSAGSATVAARAAETPQPAARVAPPAVRDPSVAARAAGGTRGAVARRESSVDVVIRAAGGDSWLEVYRGSQDVAPAYYGILARGETRRFRARRLFITAGAAHNLEVSVDGAPAGEVPDGVAQMVATREGLKTLPASS